MFYVFLLIFGMPLCVLCVFWCFSGIREIRVRVWNESEQVKDSLSKKTGHHGVTDDHHGVIKEKQKGVQKRPFITAWPRRNRKGFESALSSRRDTGHYGVMTCVFQFSVLILSEKMWPKYPYFRKDYKRDCSKFIRVIFWLLKAVSKPLDRENSSVWLVICNLGIWSFSSIVGSYCWFSSFHLRSRSFLHTDFTPKGHK